MYGFTWVACRRGSEPWKQWHAVDITRAGSRGKTFWHAEAQGGPLWLQPQVVGRPREDARIPQAEDLRIWNMVSLAGGARGILYPRWRPLLDGPLFGAFGPYGMDGKPTPRSEMAGAVARWANEPRNRDLFEAAPVRGDVGIVVAPISQIASKLLSMFGSEDSYKNILWGAYRGFFDNNIQADWVHIDDIDGYRALYLPYPLMLRAEDARRIRGWVERGGRLVSEGCPGYFGDGGAAGDVQPNLGLDDLFGVREAAVEFTPDLLDGTTFRLDGKQDVGCAEYLQTYEPGSARPCGFLADGGVVAAENGFGKGRTLLMGTCPSLAYMRHPGSTGSAFFADLLRWLGVEQAVSVDNGRRQGEAPCLGRGALSLGPEHVPPAAAGGHRARRAFCGGRAREHPLGRSARGSVAGRLHPGRDPRQGCPRPADRDDSRAQSP